MDRKWSDKNIVLNLDKEDNYYKEGVVIIKIVKIKKSLQYGNFFLKEL